MAKQGVILFAHGARDPRWAEPFVEVARRAQHERPELVVTLAFLEHLAPDLPAALAAQAAAGVRRTRVVPLFFGRGGHLRDDLPPLLERARAGSPEVAIELVEAAGESGAIQAALVAFALQDL